MFWLDAGEVRSRSWATERFEGGPTHGDLYLALVPAIRAHFLLGHLVRRVLYSSTPGSGQTTLWTALDLAEGEGEIVESEEPWDRPYDGLNVAFELEELSHPDQATGSGYGLAVPAEVIGTDELLGAEVPDSLRDAVSAFVESAAATLAPQLPAGGSPVRGDGSGMMWLFDRSHWRGIPSTGHAPMDYLVYEVSANAEAFIRGQLLDDREQHDRFPAPGPGSASLQFLIGGIRKIDFSRALLAGLQARGAAHVLNHTLWHRLFSQHAPGWLDVLAELLARGAILVDGVFEPAEPIPPLEADEIDDREVHLTVWGETRIALKRVADSSSNKVAGSACWDYVPGDDRTRPKVVVVASRGIEITPPKGVFHWDLEVFRVQAEQDVPPLGAPIEPGNLVVADLVEPWAETDADWQHSGRLWVTGGDFPRVMQRRKKDGVYLEFPVFGSTLPGTQDMAVRDGTHIPMSIDITVDPHSGTQWYAVDLHYYTYSGTAQHIVAGVHVVVWASPGVTVQSNGTEGAQPNYGRETYYWTGWTTSAEFWRVADVTEVPVPWDEVLPVTEAAVPNNHGSDIHGDIPRLAPSGSTAEHGGVSLSRLEYEQKQFKYHDSLMLDVVDLLIGLVPIVGDVVDIAETAYAWQTGRDKWGRPVTNFQLAMMTAFSAVPLLSGSLGREVADWFTETGADVLIVRAPSPLKHLFQQAASGITPGDAEIKAALEASRTFSEGLGVGTAAKAELVDALRRFLDTSDPAAMARFVRRITENSEGDWLRLADVVDANRGGFVVPVINDGFQRFRSRPGNAAVTEAEYLRSGARGKARAAAQALLGNDAVGRRPTRAGSMHPSEEGRPNFGGPDKLVKDLDHAELSDEVAAVAADAFSTPSSMQIVHVGGLSDAGRVVAADEALIRSDVDALLAHVGTDETAMKTLVGGDKLNGVSVSLRERAYRLTKALMIARDEAALVFLDPAVLTRPGVIDGLREFCKVFVTRDGHVWGRRFELRFIAQLEVGIRHRVTDLLHQLPLPPLRGSTLEAGPDSVIYMDGKAWLVQLKAFRTLDSLVGGYPKFIQDGAGVVRKVKGPSGPTQAIKDVLRADRWEGWVPGPGIASGFRPKDAFSPRPADPAAAGWVEVAKRHVLVIDDIYLQNLVMQTLGDGLRRSPDGTVRISRDVEASDGVKALLSDAFGDEIDFNDAEVVEDLMDDIAGWLKTHRDAIQAEVNAAFVDPNVTQHTGTGISYVVVLASEGVDAIPDLLRAAE